MRVILLIMIGLSLLHAELTRDSVTGIVSDSVSGLKWQDNEMGPGATWQGAIDRCEALDLGSYSDWRLPNINELKSIVDRSEVGPAVKTGFVNITSDYYWSATTYEEYKNFAWYVHFLDGDVSNGTKDNSFYVRCVRGGRQ